MMRDPLELTTMCHKYVPEPEYEPISGFYRYGAGRHSMFLI